MARFGLDSSDDSDQESQSSSPPPSPPPARATRSNKTRQTPPSRSTSNDYDDSDEGAPPVASLMRDSDDEDEQGEGSGTGEDEEMDQDDLEHSTRSRRTTRDTSRSYTESLAPSRSRHSGDESSASGSSEDESSTRSRRVPTPRESKKTGPTPWPATLQLEPQRIAVMQHSFFHQGKTAVEKAKEERELLAERKRVAAEAARVEAKGVGTGTPRGETVARSVATRPTFDARPVDMVDDTASRTYQKYGKVDLVSSTTAGKEGNYLDSGLMLGRSFRVGWSQDGRVINLGTLYNSAKPAKFDVVKLDKFKLTPTATPTSTDLLLRTLSLQLSHTTIYPSTTTSSVPVASPSASLRFHHFVAPLSPLDRTTEAHLFRLGHALFDEIKDLAIPEGASYILRDRIVELRRRERLEKWLEDVVRGEVEEDLRAAAASGGKGFAAKRIFALLSGHQVERACDSAIEGKDLRLATLVAQAGGDAAFREDVFQQLARWRKYGSNEFISKEYRRVYELLCGNVGSTEAEKDAVAFHVVEGLDWKRAFGLHLWYGTLNRSVGSAVAQYESAANVDPLVASPLPSYLEKPEATPPSSSVWKAGSDTPSDPLFQLLKIFTSPTHALESVLLPRNFGTSPLDYRLPWHLYILLSRVLRRRDFGDRVELGEDGEGRGEEGNSVRADAVTEGYAMQLEAEGRWDWAIFVLLHLELEEKREKAIRNVLSRVQDMPDESYEFVTQQLMIPPSWIHFAQATSAKYKGDCFEQYYALLTADEHNLAHPVAVLELAPEAVLRNDMVLLRKLFLPFGDTRSISDWDLGGQIYVDYADCIEEFQGGYEPTPRGRQLLLSLIHSVPTLAARGTSLKLRACVSEMQSRLTSIASAHSEHLNSIRASRLQEGDKLVHLAALNEAFFDDSLRACVA